MGGAPGLRPRALGGVVKDSSRAQELRRGLEQPCAAPRAAGSKWLSPAGGHSTPSCAGGVQSIKMLSKPSALSGRFSLKKEIEGKKKKQN